MIISSQRPLLDNTQHSQQTDIHAPGGIRTINVNKRASADPRFRPRNRWDRLLLLLDREKKVNEEEEEEEEEDHDDVLKRSHEKVYIYRVYRFLYMSQ